jgi:quercetin dioxygenase-like cupin family protein
MKPSLKTLLLVLAGLGMFGSLAAQQGQQAVLWPATSITWADNPAIPGAKIAVLWGDPKTGAYGALKSLPAGTALRVHTHTNDQKVVLLSGTIVLSIAGGASKELGAGSYAFIPGGLKHTAECKAGAECVYFEEQPGASDVKFDAAQ